MVYVGYLIVMNVHNIKKKTILKISVFELLRVEIRISRLCQRLENCIRRLCPRPLGTPPPPPRKKNPK